MTSITDLYYNFHEEYTKKYGDKVVILMVVGSFMECYSYDIYGPDIEVLANLLNIQLTRKDKSKPASKTNCYMIGVTVDMSKRHIDLLVNNGYTVVIVDQYEIMDPTKKKNPDKREFERRVSKILSIGTNIDSINDIDYNYISAVVIDQLDSSDNIIYSVGLSSIDISTGNINVYECLGKRSDPSYALDETIRFIQTFQPKELIIINKTEQSNDQIKNIFEFHKRQIYFQKVNNIHEKISYQNEFLNKIYKFSNLLSPIENIEMENMFMSRLSLIILIQFIYDHNESLINELKKPKIFNSGEHLILENNAIGQLNILENGQSTGKTSCLLNIINFTSTAIGKRLLKERLLNPITNVNKLKSQYNLIENLTNYIPDLDIILKGILDIERLTQKILTLKIQPCELEKLNISYQKIIELNKFISTIPELQLPLEIYNNFIIFYEEYLKIFNLEELQKYNQNNITSNIFNKGINSEIDQIYSEIELNHKKLTQICDILQNGLRIECNDRNGYYLTTTHKKMDIIKKYFNNKNLEINDIIITAADISIKSQTQINSRFESPQIKLISNTIIILNEQLRKICYSQYIDTLNNFNIKYKYIWPSIVNFVSLIDFLKSGAKCAIKYNYCKPEVINSLGESFILSTDSRHPIIERIDSKEPYTSNWICLGKVPEEYKSLKNNNFPDSNINGIILFGCNSLGKSSYMRQIALNLILAQIGYYVPASRFIFSPFTKIMTRILSNDNLFKGLSSFAVEMLELRSILNRADSNTLVVADELCCSSENISGISIVAATIRKFANKNVKFITATHFHELTKLECINSLEFVKCFHLEVKYCDQTKKLIYDRKLKKGSGSLIYGIEVARSLDLDMEVIRDSYAIRKQIMNIPEEVVSTKQSKYNSNLFNKECSICKKIPKQEKELEVHHIKEQRTADSNGFIGHMHKNKLSNLVYLCCKCHRQIDRYYYGKKLIINGYKLTNEGLVLDYHFITKES